MLDENCIRDALDDRDGGLKLSPALIEVLQLAADGYNVDDTAQILSKSPRTVGRQREQIVERMEAENITHAVALAIRHNLLTWQETPIDSNSSKAQ